jgi:hypothetical protein
MELGRHGWGRAGGVGAHTCAAAWWQACTVSQRPRSPLSLGRLEGAVAWLRAPVALSDSVAMDPSNQKGGTRHEPDPDQTRGGAKPPRRAELW